MFMETKHINISKIIYMIVVLGNKEVTRNMNKELRCPYGIPENECYQASGCPTWIARQQRSNK
jgi:hypothetical protein